MVIELTVSHMLDAVIDYILALVLYCVCSSVSFLADCFYCTCLLSCA